MKAFKWGALLAVLACGGEAVVDPVDEPIERYCDLGCFSIGLQISGSVTDARGEPVSNASVEGRVSGFGPFRESLTFPDGKYFVSWGSYFSGTTIDGYVWLSFTPPEDSGLVKVSLDSIPATLRGDQDPARSTDTLFVDVVLPESSSR